MASGIISVNDARLAIEADGSLTAMIGSGSVYDKKHASFARKKEVNVKVVSSDGGDLLMRNMPLFDEHDLKEMTNQSGEFKYVHIGCITVSIEPLIHQKFLTEYGKSIRGLCIIFDSTFDVFEESIICAHKFDLSEGRADFICYPNHCLSASDSNLCERLSVLLCMDNIKVKRGNEMLTMCIGHVTTGTNTLSPSGMHNTGMKTVDVKGTSEINVKEISNDIVERLESAKSSGLLNIEPMGGEQFIRPKRQGLKKYFLKAPKVVVRRNFNTALADSPTRSTRTELMPSPPRKSISAPTSPVMEISENVRLPPRTPAEANRFYIDGNLIKGAIRQKKDSLRSISARYSNKRLTQ